MNHKLLRCIPLFTFLMTISLVHAQSWKEAYNLADSMSNVTSGEVSPEAIVMARVALSKAQTQYGETDTTVARVLDLVAELLESGWGTSVSSMTSRLCKQRIIVDLLENGSGRPAEALPYAVRALTIREELLGRDHLDVARTLQLVASVHFVLGKPQDGIPLVERSVSIYEKAHATENRDYAFALQNLGFLYYYVGNFTKAEVLYTHAVDLMRRILSPNDPDFSYPLTFLAVNYWSLGLYTEAEEPLKEALRNCQAVYGVESARSAIRLGNLGQHYEMQGNLWEAEVYEKRSHAMLKKVLLPDDPILGRAYLGLGSLLKAQGKYSEAVDTLRKAIELLKVTDPRTAWTICAIGECHLAQRNYVEAEHDFFQSFTVQPSSGANETRYLESSLLGLARVYLQTGRLDAADSVLGPLVANRERLLGEKNPDLAEALEVYSELYRLRGNLSGTLDIALRAAKIRRENFLQNAGVMSESDAMLYASFLRQSVDNYLSSFIDAQPSDTSRIRQAAEIMLSTKGQTTEQSLLRQKGLVNELDSATLALADEYRYVKYQLSARYTEGPQRGNVAEYKRDLDSLDRESKGLESKLARRSLSFAQTQSRQHLSLAEIASHLPLHSSLVEYIAINYVSAGSDTVNPRYMALIVGGKGSAHIVDLGDAGRIDEAIERYQSHFGRIARLTRPLGPKEEREYTAIASNLYSLIWRPLEPCLEKGGYIFVAPDRGLNLVSFAGLIEDGKYLVEKYALHYLSAGRDVMHVAETSVSGMGLIAFGDPDFDASVAERMSSGSQLAANFGTTNPYQVRNVRSGCSQLKEISVKRLYSTRTEVESIARVWREHNAREIVEPLVGAKASEDFFKKKSMGKRMIHLATHGYFVQSGCFPTGKGNAIGGENPLLRSELLLAGANLHGDGAREAGVEDGILTALEVSAMDLRGTDRVVLSACETGLGKVEQGEGVYGLRRAFQMAGAKTVVSSLWQVPDDETVTFMKTLYSTEAETYPELMRRVALQRIQEARLRGRPTHPFTWGAFVATGEWRMP